ncbi:MAG: endonuclease domain-containing protein [Anaerolineaceae bacterium]|jgi:very-short-patch-repair endonuclease|nr:endonuclease domain-containing protein [Anaerolineaceae bacterium]
MKKKLNRSLTKISQNLRRDMTKEERHLWYDFLKGLPVTFNRQKVIGNYIVDFYCASAKLVIEIDGSQHFKPENILKDSDRDKYLTNLGLVVKRYSNLEINLDFESVCLDIYHFLYPQGR